MRQPLYILSAEHVLWAVSLLLFVVRFDRLECFAVLKSISTGFEKLNVMDLLSDVSIVVSGKGNNKWPSVRRGTRPKITKYDRTTGKMVSSSWSGDKRMPDGMAVFTTGNGDQYIAFSYGLVKLN